MSASALLLASLIAQSFDQRGFLENRTLFFPQTAANDSGQVVNETLLRYEASYVFAPWFKLAGVVDARFDSHRQVERGVGLNGLDDRALQRPALSLRRLSATLHKGKLTAEIGRQFIR